MHTNDLLYFRRNFTQCKTVVQTKETKTGVQRVRSTINAEKIADRTRFMLQGQYDFSNFKYDNLIKNATEELEPIFKKLGLNQGITKTEKKENEKKKRIAISNWIENHIEKNFPSVLKVDYDEFIQGTNIVSAKRSLRNGLEVLFSAQESNLYEIEHPVIDLETGEVAIRKARVNALPSIGLLLDKSIEGQYPTIMDFANADLKNKKALLKGLELKFSPQYLYYVLGIGNDYVTSNKSKRDKLTHTAAHKLEIFLSSIEGLQHNLSFVTFKVEEIYDILGVRRNKPYKEFKKDVLKKAISDIEKNFNKKIEIIEKRENKKITEIRFAIHRSEEDPTLKFLFHYIASQLTFFSSEPIKSLERYEKYLHNTNIEEDEYVGHKTFAEWKIEAEEAYRMEQEILSIVEEDLPFFEINNLAYSQKHHTLLTKQLLDEYDEKTKTNKVKYSFVYENGKVISNPTDALTYINNIELVNLQNSLHLVDLIPFKYYDRIIDEHININSLEMLERNRDRIQKDIVLKNKSVFGFDDEVKYASFCYLLEKGKFADVTVNFRKRILQTLDLE